VVVAGTESSAMMLLLLLHRSPAVRQARGCPERNVWNVASTYSCLGTCRPSVVCCCAQFTMRFTGCPYVRSVVRSIQVIHQRHFQPQPQRARRDIYSQIEPAGLLRATLKQEKSRFHRPPPIAMTAWVLALHARTQMGKIGWLAGWLLAALEGWREHHDLPQVWRAVWDGCCSLARPIAASTAKPATDEPAVCTRSAHGWGEFQRRRPAHYVPSQPVIRQRPVPIGSRSGGLINRRLVRFTASKGQATDGRHVTGRST